MATDLAEVIGTAIALNILFGLPIAWGVALTGLDVLILMTGWGSSSYGIRLFEFAIMGMVVVVAGCFMGLLVISSPSLASIISGIFPNVVILTKPKALYLAMSIVGATVMPHNLYLHSHVVKRRSPHSKTAEQQSSLQQLNNEMDSDDKLIFSALDPPLTSAREMRNTLKMSNLDSIVSLILASCVNASILIVAAASFYNPSPTSDLSSSSQSQDGDLKSAHDLLASKLGSFAGFLFAIGLFLSGQSSTITGTIAGQVVMEGFLGSSFKLPQWSRRLLTRVVAIVPAMTVAVIKGEKGLNDLLVLSQVVLSLQLPFAIWPLVFFTSSASIMTLRHIGHSEEDPIFTHDNGDGVGGGVTAATSTDDDDEEEFEMMGNGGVEVSVNYGNGMVLKYVAIILSLFITILNSALVIMMIKGDA